MFMTGSQHAVTDFVRFSLYVQIFLKNTFFLSGANVFAFTPAVICIHVSGKWTCGPCQELEVPQLQWFH